MCNQIQRIIKYMFDDLNLENVMCPWWLIFVWYWAVEREREAFSLLLKNIDRYRLILSIVLPRSMPIVAKSRMWSTDCNIYPLIQSLGLATWYPGLDTWKAFQCIISPKHVWNRNYNALMICKTKHKENKSFYRS